MRVTRSGRSSGGVMIFVKNSIAAYVSVQKSSKNFIWCQIDKRLTGTENDILFCGAYIPPFNSKYFSPEIFEELENDMATFRSKGSVLLSGDFNSRTGKYEDFIPYDEDNLLHYSMENVFVPNKRRNYDNAVNSHGKHLLQMCKTFDLHILNGRVRGDSFGNITYHGKLGISTVDYFICDQSLFQFIEHFIVKSPTYLSDHSQIVTWLKISQKVHRVESKETLNSKPLKKLPNQFIWTANSSAVFKHELTTPESQHLVNIFLKKNYEKSETGIENAVNDVQAILLGAAKRSLKSKVIKYRHRISNPTTKKWFDKDCRIKRHALRKVANLKRRDPLNSDIRVSYHETLTEYKQLLKNKRDKYRNDKLRELTTSQTDSQNFWNIFKSLPETTVNETSSPPITESDWLKHFGKLHSSPQKSNFQQQITQNELKSMESPKQTLMNSIFKFLTMKF